MGALATATPVDETHRRVMLDALEKSQGRLTVGDAVALSGLGRDEAEATLRGLLSTHEGHLEVSDDGELIYLFDPELAGRDDRSGWAKFKAAAWKGFKAGFKVWIMLMLVVYFVVYVVLAIAAFAALTANDRNGGGSSSRRHGGGLPIHWLLYMFWTPDWHRGRSHYYGDTYDWQRSGRRKPAEQKVPFYIKVFSFVFGPEEPDTPQHEIDQRLAWWIRAKKGVVTTAELVEFTGLPYDEADSEMGRLLGAFNGEAHVTDEGEVVYSFQELMLSAQGPVDRRELPPAWNRLEVNKKVTGNKKRDNAIIGFFNGFNLLFALISPVIIFPILNIQGAAANIGLVVVPLIFSLLFFAVPAIRAMLVKRENKKRHARNARKLVLKHVFGAAEKHGAMSRERTFEDVQRSLSQVNTTGEANVIQTQIHDVIAELDGEVEEGGTRIAFPVVERALSEGQRLRQGMRLDQQKLGEVVFGTDEEQSVTDARELRDFEDQISGGPGLRDGGASWEQQQELERWNEQLGQGQGQRADHHVEEEDEVGRPR